MAGRNFPTDLLTKVKIPTAMRGTTYQQEGLQVHALEI